MFSGFAPAISNIEVVLAAKIGVEEVAYRKIAGRSLFSKLGLESPPVSPRLMRWSLSQRAMGLYHFPATGVRQTSLSMNGWICLVHLRRNKCPAPFPFLAVVQHFGGVVKFAAESKRLNHRNEANLRLTWIQAPKRERVVGRSCSRPVLKETTSPPPWVASTPPDGRHATRLVLSPHAPAGTGASGLSGP